MEKTQKKTTLFLPFVLVIGISFLWTSCSYLSWLYRLMEFTSSENADLFSEVIGYLFQAFGILLLYLLSKKSHINNQKHLFIIISVVDLAFSSISVLSVHLATTLIFGYCMNLCHGFIAAIYLQILATRIESNQQGFVFGLGYSIGSIGTWLLTLIDDNILKSYESMVVNCILILLIAIIYYFLIENHRTANVQQTAENTSGNKNEDETSASTFNTAGFLFLASFTIIVVCTLRNIGFYFPTADISSGISLEFSRIFYAFGLITAGLLCDKKRSFGIISSACSLVFPFLMLVLCNYTNASIVSWILGYVFFGYLNVYRVLLFIDLSNQKSIHATPFFCAFGLMFGRIGDALGAYAGILLKQYQIALIVVSCILFIFAIMLLFALYTKLYMTQTIIQKIEKNEDDILFTFAQKYNISNRELDVFKEILTGISNGEISSNLFISENTVKFHIKNILKKTSCTNRNDLIALYKSQNNNI